MATIDRPFHLMPLRGMDYQSQGSYFDGTDQPGIVESPSFLTGSVNELNPVTMTSMASSINIGNAYFTLQNHYNPTTNAAVGSVNPFTESMRAFQSSEGASKFSLKTCTGFPPRSRKKHRREGDSFDDCPSKKRRFTETVEASLIPVSEGCCHSKNIIFVGDISRQCWSSACQHVTEATVNQCPNDLSSAIMQTTHSEEMEQAIGDSQCDAAHRKLQDIESRLIDDDDDYVETENSASHLPILIMSDVLKEGLKNGFEESLTKRIVDSMNRPSMELVLWKPQPSCLIDKLKTVSRIYKQDTEARKKTHTGSETSFLHDAAAFSEDKQIMSTPSSGIGTMWCREEEEMEL
ncbi:coiled-coil domain-containing protein 117 isoform X3 [Ascaphus truei]